MIKKKNFFIKIAIDSPAAAGAGTVAKSISRHYNLFYLDTGKIYRLIAYLKMKFPKKFNQHCSSFKHQLIRTVFVRSTSQKVIGYTDCQHTCQQPEKPHHLTVKIKKWFQHFFFKYYAGLQKIRFSRQKNAEKSIF